MATPVQQPTVSSEPSAPRPRRPPLRRLIVLALGLTAVFMLLRIERALVFFPTVYPDGGDWRAARFGAVDIDFPSADGTALHGWWAPVESPRAVVLFSHGNGGNISFLGPELARLRNLGLSVFAYDYRGYGKSAGRPDGGGVILDARAARQQLAKLANVSESAIVLLGRSLGGGVSVQLAAADGARALILESTFTSLPDVAAHVYPWLPARWLMRHPLDSRAAISAYRGPLLSSHGDRDGLIPYALGRALFDAATNATEPRRFIPLPGLDHNAPHPDSYYAALDAFIAALPPIGR
jgi:fermentation-respiration switch protein FrsA (DUF1100 family)